MLAVSTLNVFALMLAHRAPPHLAKSSAPPRAAVSAVFGIDNENNLRKAATAALASIVILSSPTAAFAKGGGHGGGGHGGGGGHSSHSSPATRSLHSYSRYASPKAASASSSLGQGRRASSSSRRRNGYSRLSSSQGSSSSAVILAPPPPPALLFPSESMARQEGGYYCPVEPPLPKAGEKLKVGTGRKATVLSSTPQVSIYGSQLQTVPGLDADCSVTVQYDDDGTTETLSAAEQAQPLWLKYLDLELCGAVYGGIALDGVLTPTLWDRERKRHHAMVDELNADESARLVGSRPKSGEFWGSSEESDDGDQAVRSTITFEAGGAVRGCGTDGEDGPYKITEGVWGKRAGDKAHEVTVGWIEVYYAEGFQVVVEGFYDANTGKIEARFRSSRGVRGRFKLAPKPSIF